MAKNDNLKDFLTDFANGVRKLWGIGNKETGETTDPAELIDPQELITEKWLNKPAELKEANIKKDVVIFGVKGNASGEPEKPIINLHDGEASDGEYYITAVTTDGTYKSGRHRLSQLQSTTFKPENIKYGTTIQGVRGTYIGSKVPMYTCKIKNIGAFEGADSVTISYTPATYVSSEQITETIEPLETRTFDCLAHAPITLKPATTRTLDVRTGYPEAAFYWVNEGNLGTAVLLPKPTASGGSYQIQASAH